MLIHLATFVTSRTRYDEGRFFQFAANACKGQQTKHA